MTLNLNEAIEMHLLEAIVCLVNERTEMRKLTNRQMATAHLTKMGKKDISCWLLLLLWLVLKNSFVLGAECVLTTSTK